MKRHTGLARPARDLDLFVLPENLDRALRHFAALDYRVELTFPHWLGKAHCGEYFVDVIYSSGNGIARVDDDWYEHASADTVFDLPARLCPAEEMLPTGTYHAK